jgi:hypothetical protein
MYLRVEKIVNGRDSLAKMIIRIIISALALFVSELAIVTGNVVFYAKHRKNYVNPSKKMIIAYNL